MLKIIENLGHIHPPIIDEYLVLPYEMRIRGRMKTTTETGNEVGIFLERGKVLQEHDILKTECGKLVQVKAELETIIEASTDCWQTFSRCCYHLGNRHVPLQIGEKWLRFKPDHVLQQMLEQHGMLTAEKVAPFSPENGAYSGGHHH